MMPRRLIHAHEIDELRDEDRPDLTERLNAKARQLQKDFRLNVQAEPEESWPEYWQRMGAYVLIALYEIAALAGLFLLGRWLGSWL